MRIFRRLPLPQHPIQDVLKTFRIHTSAVACIKESTYEFHYNTGQLIIDSNSFDNFWAVTVQQEGNKKIIEANLKPSGRESYLLKTEHDDHACPVCRLNVDIKHTVSVFQVSDGVTESFIYRTSSFAGRTHSQPIYTKGWTHVTPSSDRIMQAIAEENFHARIHGSHSR